MYWVGFHRIKWGFTGFARADHPASAQGHCAPPKLFGKLRRRELSAILCAKFFIRPLLVCFRLLPVETGVKFTGKTSGLLPGFYRWWKSEYCWVDRVGHRVWI